MKIIGLAGGSGSGKTTAAELFSKHGFAYIDTDAVYHSLISRKTPCLDDLVKEFGMSILNSSATLDRQKLAAVVFASGASDKLKKLNEISHYHVIKETEKIIDTLDESKYFAVLVDAPLLFESGFNKKCDKVISVVADECVRIQRIIERDNITKEKAEARINAQLSDEFLIENSDYVIVNNGDINSLSERVFDISEEIKKLKGVNHGRKILWTEDA